MLLADPRSPLSERRVRLLRPRQILLAAATLGFSAAVVQLVLFRELLGRFSGHELTLGLCLASWLALTALGTSVGSLFRHVRPGIVLLFGPATEALVGIALVLAVRTLLNPIFGRGIAIGPIATLATAIVVLAPFCLLNGALLALASRLLRRGPLLHAVGAVYAADSVGAIVGALGFTYGFSVAFDHVETLCWAACVPLLLCTGIASRLRRRRATVAWGLAVATVACLATFGELDARSTARQYGTEVVHRASTPYGRLVVTRNAGQFTFFENGSPIGFSSDAIAVEEIVHFTLAQRPHARSVLVIGGTVSGVATEVLRYPDIRSVTCIELDPAIVDTVRRIMPERLADARIHVITTDARRFVLETGDTFDAILITLPDPTTYQLNRFYTAEFLRTAKRHLGPAGVLALGLGRYENVVGPELRRALSSTHATFASVFGHVAAIPGGRVFFLGSDAPLTRDIASALEQAQIEPQLVTRSYLDATLAPDRLADIDRSLSASAPLNTDDRPILPFIRTRQWLSQFGFSAGGLLLAVTLVGLAWFLRLASVPRMVFAAGFAGSALEIVLLALFQAAYGVLYRQLGAVMAAFMLGLALGSGIALRAPPTSGRRATTWLALSVAMLAIGFALLPSGIAPLPTWLGQALLLAATLALALAVGAQFATAAVAEFEAARDRGTRLFSADLLGAALGSLLASTYLLPVFGLVPACLVCAGLNLLAAVLGWRTPRPA